jgi:hypothetical protein
MIHDGRSAAGRLVGARLLAEFGNELTPETLPSHAGAGRLRAASPTAERRLSGLRDPAQAKQVQAGHAGGQKVQVEPEQKQREGGT